MTPEQLALAKKFCELVGWKIVWTTAASFRFVDGIGAEHSATWLFTGDGQASVKAEMVKRGKVILSWTQEDKGGACWNMRMGQTMSFADTEPEAVLKAAVAAMEGDK